MQNSRLNFIRRKCKTYRPYQFKFFKSGLPQILFGPFLNNLTQIVPGMGLSTVGGKYCTGGKPGGIMY